LGPIAYYAFKLSRPDKRVTAHYWWLHWCFLTLTATSA
jgi:hypothetical protein